MVVIARDTAWFLTDFRYQSQAARQVSNEYSIVIARKGLWHEAARLLKKDASRIGFEAEHTSVAALVDIEKMIKPAQAVATKRVVEDLRLLKDEDEVRVIEHAVKIIDECFDYICGVLKPGMSELKMAELLEGAMRQRGASGPSFTSIVASGRAWRFAHGVASDKIIEPGDMVDHRHGSDFRRLLLRLHAHCVHGQADARAAAYLRNRVARANRSRCGFASRLSMKEADMVARQMIAAEGWARLSDTDWDTAWVGNSRTSALVTIGQRQTCSGHDRDVRTRYLPRRLGRSAHRRHAAYHR
jgi:hypothetical protein